MPNAITIDVGGGIHCLAYRPVAEGSEISAVATDECAERCGCGAEFWWKAVLCGVESLPEPFDVGIYVPSTAVCTAGTGGGPIALNQVFRGVGGLCFKVLNGPEDDRYVARPEPEPSGGPGEPPAGFEWLPIGAYRMGTMLSCVADGCADSYCSEPRFFLTEPCPQGPQIPVEWPTPAVAAVDALPWFAKFGGFAFDAGGYPRCVNFSVSYTWDEISAIAEEWPVIPAYVDDRAPPPPNLFPWHRFGHGCCTLDPCRTVYLWNPRNGDFSDQFPGGGTAVIGLMFVSGTISQLPFVKRLDTGASLVFDSDASYMHPFYDAVTTDIRGESMCFGHEGVVAYARTQYFRYEEPGSDRVYEEWLTESGSIPHDSDYTASTYNVFGSLRQKQTYPSAPWLEYDTTVATRTGYSWEAAAGGGGPIFFNVRHQLLGDYNTYLQYDGWGVVQAVDGMHARQNWRNNTSAVTFTKGGASGGGTTGAWAADLYDIGPGGGDVYAGRAEVSVSFTWPGPGVCGAACPPEGESRSHGVTESWSQAIEEHMSRDPMRRCRGCGG